jgi:NMD protein affecting ribosome stability and mRNA decay
MSDEVLEKIYDQVFKEKVENHLRDFIKEVSNIKTDSIYRVLYSVRIVNMNTGNVIDLERY